MRALVLGLLLASAVHAQPSAADTALVDRLLVALGVGQGMDIGGAGHTLSPGIEMLGGLINPAAIRDSVREALLDDVRPSHYRQAVASLESPAAARVDSLMRAWLAARPLSEAVALLSDPGNAPLADSSLAARYAIAHLDATQPADVFARAIRAMLDALPATLRTSFESTLAGDDARDRQRDVAIRSARLTLADADPADLITLADFYEGEAARTVGWIVAEATARATRPAMQVAMRQAADHMEAVAPRVEARPAADDDPVYAIMDAVQAALVYPEDARAEGVEGVVVLRLVLDADGAVVEARASRSPDERLTSASLAAVAAVEFAPPSRVNAEGVAPLTFPVTFRLR